MRVTCWCSCHRASPFLPFHGADVTDAVAAVTACDACRRHHCPALLERTIWDPSDVPPDDPPLGDASTACDGDDGN